MDFQFTLLPSQGGAGGRVRWGCLCPLIRQARVAVLYEDDAAIGETVLLQEGTHGAVVLVRVYADGVGQAEGILQNLAHDAMYTRCGGNAVDDIVGKGVEPLAFEDLGIRGVGTFYQGKGGNGALAVRNHVTDTVGNVVLNLLERGMTVGPLCGVALGNHFLPSVLDEAEDERQIVYSGFSYIHQTRGCYGLWLLPTSTSVKETNMAKTNMDKAVMPRTRFSGLP